MSKTISPAIAKTDLSRIVAEIKEAHAQVLGGFRTSLDHARRCGELLTQAKESMKHGEWIMFTQKHRDEWGFSDRTERYYRAIFENWNECQAVVKKHGHIEGGIKGLLNHVKPPKKRKTTSTTTPHSVPVLRPTTLPIEAPIAKGSFNTALNTIMGKYGIVCTVLNMVKFLEAVGMTQEQFDAIAENAAGKWPEDRHR